MSQGIYAEDMENKAALVAALKLGTQVPTRELFATTSIHTIRGAGWSARVKSRLGFVVKVVPR